MCNARGYHPQTLSSACGLLSSAGPQSQSSRSVPTAYSHTHTHTHTGVFTLSSLSLDTQAEASASSTPLSQLSLQNGPDPGLVHFLDGPTVAVTPAAHAGSASALRVAGVGGRQSPRVRGACSGSSNEGWRWRWPGAGWRGGSGGWGATHWIGLSEPVVASCPPFCRYCSADSGAKKRQVSSLGPTTVRRTAVVGRTGVGQGWAGAHGDSPRPPPRGSPWQWQTRPV